MPTTKVIKPKPVAATRATLERTKPVQVRAVSGAQSELRVPGPGRPRASSCPRSPRPDRSERTTAKTGSERRSRSSSTAPQTTATWPRTNPDHRKTTSPAKHVAVNPKHRDVSACPGQREQRGGRTETGTGTATGTGRAGHSHKAFTVIPPNPKKRREIQRKAEAELAALEELRLSRAMAYVSISPSSVGGCMSLEEVRLKQQQEMMQAKKKQKPVKALVMERTPDLRS